MLAFMTQNAVAAPVTPTASVIPSATPTPDQQREQILQLALMVGRVNGLMLTPEQELQINQLANSLCGPCPICRSDCGSYIHAAWRLQKRYPVTQTQTEFACNFPVTPTPF
jgi:hypothetical protein